MTEWREPLRDELAGRVFREPTPWAAQAACLGTDPALWFPERGTPVGDARKICWSCPVREECLDYALRNREKFGIWGGHSERERRALRRGVPVAQRPPKPPKPTTIRKQCAWCLVWFEQERRPGAPTNYCGEECKRAGIANKSRRKWDRGHS